MLNLPMQFIPQRVVFAGRLCELLLKRGILRAGLRADDRPAIWRRLAGIGEHAVQRVIILNRDRVVFMIVTTGTCRREAEEPTGHNVDAVVDDFVREKIEARSHSEKPQRSH